jgi:uncharacterized protein
VLLLRGSQTPGELKARTERMAPLGSLADVERIVQVLTERGYVRRIGRRPGQKEDRFEHLLGGAGGGDGGMPAQAAQQTAPYEPSPAVSAPAVSAPAVAPIAAPAPAANENGGLADRVAALEAEVATLRSELEELRELYG